MGRHVGLREYKQRAQSKILLDFTMYSDGSMDNRGNLGARFCVYRGTQEILYVRIPLGSTAEVNDVGIIRTVAWLRETYSHIMARFCDNSVQSHAPICSKITLR